MATLSAKLQVSYTRVCGAVQPFPDWLSLWSAVALERVELKEMFTRQHSRCKVHVVQSSRLWKHMKEQTRRGTIAIHAYILPAAAVNCTEIQGVCVCIYVPTHHF